MTAPFISSADLGTFVGEDLSTSQLAVIAIDSACEAVRTELQQLVNLATKTYRLDGTNKPSLILPQLPVRSVSAVITYDAVGENEKSLLENVDYIVGGAGILWLMNGERWPAGKSNIVVTYTHGWDLTEDVQQDGSGSGGADTIERVPSDIRFVALSLAAGMMSGGKVGVGGVTSESVDNYSYSIAAGGRGAAPTVGMMTAEHRRMLDRYRVEAVA